MGPDHRPGINSIVCIYIYVCVEFVGTLDSISISFSQFLVFSIYNFYSDIDRYFIAFKSLVIIIDPSLLTPHRTYQHTYHVSNTW